MFVKHHGKLFLSLSDSQLSLILGLIQERQKSILDDDDLKQEIFCAHLIELCDLQNELILYRDQFERN